MSQWVWQGEQPLKKKGIGCGLHQSDMICSTFGWLKDVSQTLEYGKNYDRYWNGELFVKQVCLKLRYSHKTQYIILSSWLKKLYLPLKRLMDHHIKHLSWSIIHKAILHILWMPFWHHEWTWDLVANRQICEMGGLFGMASESYSWCVFQLITQNFLGNQRECAKLLLSGVCGRMGSLCSARRAKKMGQV